MIPAVTRTSAPRFLSDEAYGNKSAGGSGSPSRQQYKETVSHVVISGSGHHGHNVHETVQEVYTKKAGVEKLFCWKPGAKVHPLPTDKLIEG